MDRSHRHRRIFPRLTGISLAIVVATSAFPVTVTALPSASVAGPEAQGAARYDDPRQLTGAGRIDYSAVYGPAADELPDDLRLLDGARVVNPILDIAARRAAEAAAAEAAAIAKAQAEAAARAAAAKAEAAAKAAAAKAATATTTTTTKAASTAPVYRGKNRFWYPKLGINQSVYWFPCSRSREPDNLVYRWGCAGANNVYLMAHAWGKFSALNRAYYNHTLRAGQLVVYADGNGRTHYYRLAWWKTARPTTSASWAWAAQSRSALTLQTCIGANSEYRLFVRFYEVAKP
jgi:hypothetical protein